ncbi:MAG: sigma-70 family RNA polymerase sigma factor [Phycisphaeraceae bacterium]|nr:sigma-70 family RNA polymerase sigma factor [Phycisphaeraceae bacterium]
MSDPGPDVDAARVQVTQLLRAAPDDHAARARLLEEVYGILRTIAQQRMREERAGHTLQATALVHEAFIRLVGDDDRGWESRAHFFRSCAQAMRRILIDHARRRGADKRGGGARPVGLECADLGVEHDPLELLALDDAMTTLEAEDPRAAEVVSLRFFSGLSVEETAEILGISPRTVIREWIFARARLHELLAGAAGSGSGGSGRS